MLQRKWHQKWHRLVLSDFNDGHQFEGLIHEYETWSEPSELPEPIFLGVRGEGDIETSRVRAARREKRKIRLPSLGWLLVRALSAPQRAT